MQVILTVFHCGSFSALSAAVSYSLNEAEQGVALVIWAGTKLLVSFGAHRIPMPRCRLHRRARPAFKSERAGYWLPIIKKYNCAIMYIVIQCYTWRISVLATPEHLVSILRFPTRNGVQSHQMMLTMLAPCKCSRTSEHVHEMFRRSWQWRKKQKSYWKKWRKPILCISCETREKIAGSDTYERTWRRI